MPRGTVRYSLRCGLRARAFVGRLHFAPFLWCDVVCFDRMPPKSGVETEYISPPLFFGPKPLSHLRNVAAFTARLHQSPDTFSPPRGLYQLWLGHVRDRKRCRLRRSAIGRHRRRSLQRLGWCGGSASVGGPSAVSKLGSSDRFLALTILVESGGSRGYHPFGVPAPQPGSGLAARSHTASDECARRAGGVPGGTKIIFKEIPA